MHGRATLVIMLNHLKDVSIIGAGLGGCALALALSENRVPVTLFESRTPNAEVFRSGVILTPNGLRVLDRLGVLRRIQDRCYKPTHRTTKNDKDETTRKAVVADESMYGYSNHRLWRKILLEEMKAMLDERSISINYNSKFNGILSDGDDGVEFLINDKTCRASLLIGSDGVNSSVRNYIQPGIVPEYTGLVAILCHIQWDSVNWPYEEYERNCTIQGKPGAIIYIPEDPDAETIMVGMQISHPQPSRKEMEQLQADPDKLVEFFLKGYDDWGPTARSIIDSIVANKRGCYIWPYVKIPHLQRWYSATGRVIILGDAAHGLPPSSGQGVNQALEDIYALTLLLTPVDDGSKISNGATQHRTPGLLDALEYWQQMRQSRIDAVFDWTTNFSNVTRLPDEERRKLIAEGKFKEGQDEDMSWLYEPRLEDDVKGWLKAYS